MRLPPNHIKVGTEVALIGGEQGAARQTTTFGVVDAVTFTETAETVSVSYKLRLRGEAPIIVSADEEIIALDSRFGHIDSESLGRALIARSKPGPIPEPEPEVAPTETPASESDESPAF